MVKKLFIVLMVVVAWPLFACDVDLTLTDVTAYGVRVGRNTIELQHPFSFHADAPGAKLTVIRVFDSAFIQRGGTTCENPADCTLELYCLRPGTYQIDAAAQCDSATMVRKKLPLVVPENALAVEIAKIEPIGPGQYDVHSIFTVPAGVRVFSAGLAVFPLLPDGTYGTPRSVSSHIIDAATGDKVQIIARTCEQRIIRAEGIVPPPPSIEVSVLDGDGQRAVIGEPAERPLRVKFTASDPSWDLTNLPAVFEVLTAPEGAAGHGVGADDALVAQSYPTSIDADGVASATIVVGDIAGSYVVRVQSPQSVTGSTAIFTTTAVRPEKVAILKDTTEMADHADTYAVSATDATTFHAVGIDGSGAKIGPMRCNWSTTAKGSPTTRGDGSLSGAVNVRTTTFQPARVGRLTLRAETSMKGVTAGTADLFITKLYVDVDGLFDASAPADEYPQFVPGSTLGGASAPLATVRSGQRIGLHVLTGESSRGKVTFTLSDVSNFPGVAMNFPVAAPSAAPDLALRSATGTTVQTLTVPFSGTGDTSATLVVLDYGARGKLRVTIESGRSVYQLAAITLPKDANANGIADGGWKALANSATGTFNHVPDVYAPASDGDNDPEVSGLPIEGRTGDGLAVFEEYRGFVVRGEHRRLHPLRKDVFVLVHPDHDVFDDRIRELPLAVHEIVPGESDGEFGPVINPNRASIAGATQQRGIFVRLRHQPPLYRRLDGSVVSADFDFAGYTFPEGDNLNLIDETAYLALVRSPNETIVSEVFDWTFWRHYISYGPNATRDTVVHTRDLDEPDSLLIRGLSDWIQSTPNSANAAGDDFQTGAVYTVCGDGDNRPYRAFTLDEALDAYQTTFLHEVAHALDIEHDQILCSPSIMSAEAAVPVHRSLTSNDRSQIRVHRKHN